MSAAVQVSLAEYLSTDYEPDCEYIDGVLEDRNVGKSKHSRTQALLTMWLGSREKQHGHKVMIEQRVQISRSRVRIPDICLVLKDDQDEVVQHPPLLWIEILSPDDRWSRVQAKLADVLRFGVGTIWIIDPFLRQAWMATQDMPATEVDTLRCDHLGLEVPLNEVLPED